MEPHDAEARTVKATETSLAIIDYLQETDGARLSEIAQKLGCANSTVYHHLTTLMNQGYVVREDETYHIGLEFLQVGGYARDRTTVNRLSQTFVESLAEKTGEQAQFIVEENGRGYHVYTAPGEHATPIDTRPGKRIYLHANSSGKSILAHYPTERVEAILDRWGLPTITEYTITDRDAFFDELERVREQGYAYNREEHVLGYCGAAAPVQTQDGAVLGALALGGPTKRLQNGRLEDELTQVLLEVVNEFELQVEFS